MNRNPWRSKKYLAWVRQQPCIRCGAEAEPHHLKGIGNMGGVGQKAPDWATMPLCRRCHDDMHRDSSGWEYQWEMIVRTVGNAISEGVLK